MFTAAKAKSRPRPRFIAWSIQTIANGSSRRAFFNGPASTGSKPSLLTSSITAGFLPASSPATSITGFDRIVGRLGHIARTRRVECLEDKGTWCPACDLLAGRGVDAEDKLQPVGTHTQWVHAVDHDPIREAAEALDRRLGRGPGRRHHHDLGLFNGFGWRFDAVLG